MTTITIERELLKEVVDIFDNAISTRYPHEILRDIRAALEAPATAPAWHDAPTCAGNWICDEGGPGSYAWLACVVSWIEDPALKKDGFRWFGPIPEERSK